MGQDEKRDPRTFAIIGAAMEVHRELGPGFLEVVYQDALQVEFKKREIPHQREVELPVYYKGELLEHSYRADYICYDEVVVELKAMDALTGKDEAQIIHYLKVTRSSPGLLLNFGSDSLQFKRFVV